MKCVIVSLIEDSGLAVFHEMFLTNEHWTSPPMFILEQ